MPKLIVYRGPSGSGKSTAAQKAAKETGAVVVERDLIRERLYGSRSMQGTDEGKVTKIHHAEIRGLLEAGLDVICSDTNLRDRYVRDLAKIAWVTDAEFQQVIFYENQETCEKRNKERPVEQKVPDGVIEKQFKQYDFNVTQVDDIIFPVERYSPNFNWFGDELFIFDIDGTTFSMGDRSPYEWTKVHLDKPRRDVLNIADQLGDMEGHKIIFLSGRDEVCFADTHKALSENLSVPFDLFMRGRKDNRPDTIVKYELFNKHIRPTNLRVGGVWDDRESVVRLWRKLGLTTHQVDYGRF